MPNEALEAVTINDPDKGALPVMLYDSTGAAITTGLPTKLVDNTGAAITNSNPEPVRMFDGSGNALYTNTSGGRTVLAATLLDINNSAIQISNSNPLYVQDIPVKTRSVVLNATKVAADIGTRGSAVDVTKFRRLFFMTNVTAIAGGTLTMYLDTSDDGGATWPYGAILTLFNASATGATLTSAGPGMNSGTYWASLFGDTVSYRIAGSSTFTSVTVKVTMIGES